jgi:hypothetical protein
MANKLHDIWGSPSDKYQDLVFYDTAYIFRVKKKKAYREDGDTRFLRNIGTHVRDYASLQLRRLKSQ